MADRRFIVVEFINQAGYPTNTTGAIIMKKKFLLIVMTTLVGLLFTGCTNLSIGSTATPQFTPTPIIPTETALPTTKNPKCGTIVTLVDKTTWLFGETKIPISMKGISYRGIVVGAGLMEVSDGSVDEISINNKTLALVSKDLKGGVVHSKEFGDIKMMAGSNLSSVCVLLVATPEQVSKISEWLK